MDTIIKISKNQTELAWDFARELAGIISESATMKRAFTIALSGGSSPKLLFSILGDNFSDTLSWEYVHFFWGDERCVPPDDPESNFGMTKKVLLDKIDIPQVNIHRIIGERDPFKEVVRYSEEIAGFTTERGGLPIFDLIILGLGEDGHTASIFPGDNKVLNSQNICEVATHPVSFQKRITITAKVINNAEKVIFLVTGAGKSEVVSAILERPGIVDYPAALINPQPGVLKWYLDDAAGSMVDRSRI